jgi:hypothetical protein
MRLSELTTWQGESPGLWRRALEASHPSSAAQHPRRILARRVPGWLVGGLAAATVLAAGVWLTMPSLYLAREVSISAHRAADKRTVNQRFAEVAADSGAPSVPYAAAPLQTLGYLADQAFEGESVPAVGAYAFSVPGRRRAAPATDPSGGAGQIEPLIERQVIRKATIEMTAKDVRAAFLKAALLISEARGEYIQDSGLTDTGHRLEGNLTLRVAADRLSEVLNELRQLGEVRSERSAGEDVTVQVVDVEARLRNEQRVEAELLQLLEKRADAPLKEILELRTSIASVRQTIEQLTAQREKLGRLVSLATVLVIIRPADAPPVTESGLWARFADQIERAASKGLRFLFDTLSAILSVLIGGLVWWVLLIVAILVVRAHRRRAAKTGP